MTSSPFQQKETAHMSENDAELMKMLLEDCECWEGSEACGHGEKRQ